MENFARTTSSLIAVALVATAASPAAAAEVSPINAAEPSAKAISVDQYGNLMFAGMTSDDALAQTYGLMPDDAALAALDVNIGKCTVTNNCACGDTAQA